MLIQHLVLSGAGYHGIQLLGTLFKAEETLFKFSNIKSVYGTSAGSIVLAIWLLRLEKYIVYDFIINRPWEKTYVLGANVISNLIGKKGVFENNIINEILIPLLRSKFLDTDLTLKQFYEITKVDFHIIATSVDTLEPIDFSHKTHPDLPILDAVYMSSAIPFIFQPRYYNGSYVADGGLSIHFPINPCIENGAQIENILGITVSKKSLQTADENTPLTEYTFQMLNSIFRRLSKLSTVEIPYLITIELTSSLEDFPSVITDSKIREKLWKNGEEGCVLSQCRVEELA